MQSDISRKLVGCFSIMKAILIKDTWRTITPSDVLLVRNDGDCGYRYEGKAYAQLADSFGEFCNTRGLSINSVANPYSLLTGSKAYFSPISFHRSFFLIDVGSIGIRIVKGIQFSNKWKEDRRIGIWYQIIEKSKPKCIIAIQPDEILCQAGRLKEIPVYDLQHGIITQKDPYYGESYRINTPREKLPAGFLCWDLRGAGPILRWASGKGIQIVEIGNPWFSRFIWINPEDLLVKKALSATEISPGSRPVILVSLQYKMAEIAPNQVMNGVIVNALETVILQTQKLYSWILRFHPVQMNGVEWDKTYNYLVRTFGIEKTRFWLDKSMIPLPVVLKKVDLHVTFSSAVVVEAAWMGIRSGLLDQEIGRPEKDKDWFPYERSVGMAEVISNNPDRIKEWIRDTLAKGHGEPTLKDHHQNIEEFINDIKKVDS